MTYDLLSVSDITAAVVGYVYADQLHTRKPTVQAVQSLIVSVIARITANSGMSAFMGSDTDIKNQIVVAVLSAIGSSYKGGGPMKGALSGVSIDLIAEDILRLLKIDDRGFFSMQNMASGGGDSGLGRP